LTLPERHDATTLTCLAPSGSPVRAGFSLVACFENASGPNSASTVHRLSRHAIRYNGDLRASSTAVLDKPISASRWSSSSKSCLHWCRRSKLSAIPASHASGIFQDHLKSGNEGEAAWRVLVEMGVVLPQDMFHLHNGAKQRLAAGAHRAVVNGPSDFCITLIARRL
jgi:hypothetical protein